MAYRAKFVQKLGGGELSVRRACPVTITEETLKKHLEEIKAKAAQGLLEVRTPGGELVDLATLKAAKPAPAPPKPAPPPDSLANDKVYAERKPLYPNAPVETDDLPEPDVGGDLPEGEEEVADVKDPAAKRRKKKG